MMLRAEKLRRWRTLAACVLVVTANAAQGEGIQQPFELVRSLRALQDRIAYGDASAHAGQKAALAQIAESLDRADDGVWEDEKNLRAAVAFVLGGGNPGVLRKLLSRGHTRGMVEKLIKGALAYAQGHIAEAGVQLGSLDARQLDATIAGHIALVQAELAIKKDPARALGLFDQARLLSPGTLVEEAALRRQMTLLAAEGNFEKFETMSSTYMRRFPKSVYAGAFKALFVDQIVGHEEAMHKLVAMLAGLSRWDRRDLYLAIAKAGVVRGKVELVRIAAPRAAELADGDSMEGMRSKLFEAAVLVVTDEFAKGAAQLQALSPIALGKEDAELLDAARAVAMEVRRAAAEDGIAQPAPPADTPTLKSVVAAQAAIVAADTLLKGTEK